MGPMYNPFYHDIGLSKEMVGAVRGSIGLVATFAGIAVGGFCALKFGYMRALIVGGGDAPFSEAELVYQMMGLIFAGHETVTHLIGNAL